MPITSHIATLLSASKAQHQWRERIAIEDRNKQYVTINGNELINFTSNDYLHIADHPAVKKSFANAALKYGLGSGSSPLISGYTTLHQALEETMAQFLNRDKALLFNSGYHANLAIVTTFAQRKSVIVADKLCHASLIDGITLSRGKLHRYAHQDFIHAEKLLQHFRTSTKLLITESVFSMEGDITNIHELAQLAEENRAMFVVDDAHGIGILGANGNGACEHFQLSQKEVPCLITPLGKAIGSVGAVVTGSNELIEALLQSARSYRYSTALPAAICAGTITAIEVLQTESWRRSYLQELIKHFNHEAMKRNLTLSSNAETPIKSIVVGCNQTVVDLQQYLLSHGLFVSSIRPPTVPKNSARIRISLTSALDKSAITTLLDHIAEYLDERAK